MRPLLLCLLSGAALAQQVPGGMHVVELHDKADANLDQLLALFASFGVGADKARPLVQKVCEERERGDTRARTLLAPRELPCMHAQADHPYYLRFTGH